MKYLISSDWQFANYARLSTVTSSGLTSRLVEFCDCFRWMLDVADQSEITELVILGDFFDDRVAVPVTVLHAVADLLEDGRKRGLNFHLLVGNHDAALKTPDITSLTALSGLAKIYDTPEVFESLGFVPWTADADTLQRQCTKMAKNQKVHYLLSHVMVEGAVPKASGLPIDTLSPESFKRVLLGDVHNPVKVKPNIQYIGAPLQINFGDADGSRGIWLLDTKTDKMKFIENPVSPKFWNIEKESDAGKVASKDYAKVRMDNPDAMDATLETLELQSVNGVRVVNETVQLEEVTVRLPVNVRDSSKSVLTRYCQHQEVRDDEVSDLVEVGLSLLNEAKG